MFEKFIICTKIYWLPSLTFIHERKIESAHIVPCEIKIEGTLMEAETSKEFIEWARG